MKVQYIKTSDAIKGYQDSSIAKSETNDCVVRAFASAFEIGYDEAHNFIAEKFKRQPRKGTFGFGYGMNLISKNDVKFNGKGIEIITHEYGSMLYYVMVKGHKTLRSTTTNSFIKMYPTGTYIVIVKGHAFTIKNGCVIGNLSDAKQIRKHIISAWKIG